MKVVDKLLEAAEGITERDVGEDLWRAAFRLRRRGHLLQRERKC